MSGGDAGAMTVRACHAPIARGGFGNFGLIAL